MNTIDLLFLSQEVTESDYNKLHFPEYFSDIKAIEKVIAEMKVQHEFFHGTINLLEERIAVMKSPAAYVKAQAIAELAHLFVKLPEIKDIHLRRDFEDSFRMLNDYVKGNNK